MGEMDENQREELLIRLDERTKNIQTLFTKFIDHADNGGWSRCARRGKQIDQLDEEIRGHQGNHKWFNRLLISLTLAQVFVIVFGVIAMGR